MELHDYPAGIERARLALAPVKQRLRAVREEQIAIRDRLKMRVAAEVEALDHVREDCAARLERLRHEFDLAVAGRRQEGGAN